MKVKDLSQLKPTRNVIYCRTVQGHIHKLLQVGNYWIDCLTGIAINTGTTSLVGEFSTKLIDLVELGDYVNGEKVEEISKPSLANDYKKLIYCNECEGLYSLIISSDNEIKNILTKQQYEANCFKV